MEHNHKVVILGDCGSGKTSFVGMAAFNRFDPNQVPTLGVDFGTWVFHSGNDTHILKLWDISGKERYGNMTRVYYKDAFGCIIMCDCNQQTSIDATIMWLHDFKAKGSVTSLELPCYLIFNKMDLMDVNATQQIMDVMKSQAAIFTRVFMTACGRSNSKDFFDGILLQMSQDIVAGLAGNHPVPGTILIASRGEPLDQSKEQPTAIEGGNPIRTKKSENAINSETSEKTLEIEITEEAPKVEISETASRDIALLYADPETLKIHEDLIKLEPSERENVDLISVWTHLTASKMKRVCVHKIVNFILVGIASDPFANQYECTFRDTQNENTTLMIMTCLRELGYTCNRKDNNLSVYW
jgi:small GTP-binding protein